MFALSQSRTILPVAMLAAVAATCLQFAAFAAPGPFEPRSIKVHFGDLDLTTPAGVKRFDERIAVAVRNVCLPTERRAAGARSQEMECRQAARTRAFAQRDLKVQQAMAGEPRQAGRASSTIEFGID
jgi:UrcA family protein